jgi:hypothetical protein
VCLTSAGPCVLESRVGPDSDSGTGQDRRDERPSVCRLAQAKVASPTTLVTANRGEAGSHQCQQRHHPPLRVRAAEASVRLGCSIEAALGRVGTPAPVESLH